MIQPPLLQVAQLWDNQKAFHRILDHCSMTVSTKAANSKSADVSHHQVFQRFSRWSGVVPPDRIANFLGVMTRTNYGHPYFSVSTPSSDAQVQQIDYPAFDEEYFEWIDLLESVAQAQGHFTMLELGAGWGRWVANAAIALRQFSGLPHTFVAVEAEPSHFQSITQHLADNAINPDGFQLIEAAVTDHDGEVLFQVGKHHWGDNYDWHGQSIIGGDHAVKSVSLATLLRPFSTVDLIDLDIQGAELSVLLAAADVINEKAKKIHIGTHSRRIEHGLRSLFSRLGWRSVYDFPCLSQTDTPWGSLAFLDGVQTWLNPLFLYQPEDELGLLKERFASSRKEGDKLWAELEQAHADQNELNLIRGSVSWKVIRRVRSLRDSLAPQGTRRRKLYDRFPGFWK